jgi:L-ascorbate metabolism protein UlaG (beta-lactamase superfamily)
VAKQPSSVEIRAYQVGFGDCFLVTFVYDATDRRSVLIDFGTTELPAVGGNRLQPSKHMPIIANEIQKDCEGRLTAVVATHRHADHISGFATDTATGKSGEIIKSLKPKLVLQPWTEDPDAKTDATKATRDSSRSPKSFTSGLQAMHDIARDVVAITERPPTWMSAALRKELAFIGQDNIRNRSAVENLLAMGAARGARAVWAHHGSPSGLDPLLPGVKVHVLGPPNLEQTEKIRKQRSRDPDQFWHLLAGPKSLQGANVLAHGLAHPRNGRAALPVEARWFRERLDRMRGDQLLQIVRTLDNQMNNTSLILLVEVGGKKLLFPGDAQIENWSYALQEAEDAGKTRALLADVDVYKVGHHGSLNATPKTLLWENFTKKGSTKRLRTILSTLPGKHGKVASKTEVPRRPLLEALEKETTLLNTHDYPLGQNIRLSEKVVIKVS